MSYMQFPKKREYVAPLLTLVVLLQNSTGLSIQLESTRLSTGLAMIHATFQFCSVAYAMALSSPQWGQRIESFLRVAISSRWLQLRLIFTVCITRHFFKGSPTTTVLESYTSCCRLLRLIFYIIFTLRQTLAEQSGNSRDASLVFFFPSLF